MLKNYLRLRKGDIGLTEIVFILATIIAVAVILYIIFSIIDQGMVITYD